MSDSIYAEHYHYPSLLTKMKDIGASNESLLRAIFTSCGTVYGDVYIILNSSRLDFDHNPYDVLITLLDTAFPLIEYTTDDVLDELKQDSISEVYLHDIAERLGITLEDEE